MTNRVRTGVPGLDEMLSGGFLEGSTVLLLGAPGTGKTTLGLQFLYNGIVQENEPGLFITFEEFPAGTILSNQYAPTGDPVPVPSFETKSEDPNTWIRPVAGKPLTFQTAGVGKPNDVTLVPFYKLTGQRYGIYWKIELLK